MSEFLSFIDTYWSSAALQANAIVCANLLGAMLLGLVVGYERSYHGRAAGMRTYGLVCMASAALTVIGGYPEHWFGGQAVMASGIDPTRVIQGVVTGIGFLGAGVIMREGFNISGLTTAASIWASAAIGILVGVGFYVAAIVLSFLSMACMIWVSKLESWLPSRQGVAITLRFKREFVPRYVALQRAAMERGYEIASGSLSISCEQEKVEWRFVALAFGKQSSAPLSDLSHELMTIEGVETFHLSYARN